MPETSSVVVDLDLSGMNTSADLDTDPTERVTQTHAASNALRRSIERHQQPVAGALHDSPSVLVDRAASDAVVTVEQGPPRSITALLDGDEVDYH